MKNFTNLGLHIAALIAVACNGIVKESVEPGNGQVPPVLADSLQLDISFHPECHLPSPDGTEPIKTLDVFVYGADGTRELEYRGHLDGFSDSLSIKVSEGRKIVVAICNFPYIFNLDALRKYDSMSLLTLGPEDEDASHPLLSGATETTNEGEVTIPVSLRLTPLLCCVRIAAVNNALDGYELLESPSVWLSGRNPEAEVFRQTEFRPKEEMPDYDPVPLPCDIGFYTQEPGIDLYCYPNDTPEEVLGTSRTEINFECSINGRRCLFTKRLPPFGRGTFLKAELTVFSADEAVWEIK